MYVYKHIAQLEFAKICVLLLYFN